MHARQRLVGSCQLSVHISWLNRHVRKDPPPPPQHQQPLAAWGGLSQPADPGLPWAGLQAAAPQAWDVHPQLQHSTEISMATKAAAEQRLGSHYDK